MSLIKKYRKQFAAVTLSIGAISVAPIDVDAAASNVGTKVDGWVTAGGSATYDNLTATVEKLEAYLAQQQSTAELGGINVADGTDYIIVDSEEDVVKANQLIKDLDALITDLNGLIATGGSLLDDVTGEGTGGAYKTAVTELITSIKTAYLAIDSLNATLSYAGAGEDLDTTYVTLEQRQTLIDAVKTATTALSKVHAEHHGLTVNASDDTILDELKALTDADGGASGAADSVTGNSFTELIGTVTLSGTDDDFQDATELASAKGILDTAVSDYTVGGTAEASTINAERAAIAFELLKAKASLGLDLAAALPTADVTEGNIATVFANAGKVFAVNDTATPPTVTVATAAPASPLYAPMVIADNASSDTVGVFDHNFDNTADKQLNYVTLSEANATIAKIRALEAKLLDYDGMDDTTTTSALTLYTDELITNEINEDTLDNLTEVKEDIIKEVQAFEKIQKEGTGANKDDRADRIVELLDYLGFATFTNADGTETGGLVTGGTTWAKGISLMSADLEDMKDYSGDDDADLATTFAKATVSHLYGIDVAAGDKWVTPAVHDALYKVAKEARIQYEIYTGKAYVDGGAGTDATTYPNRAELAKTQTLKNLEDAAEELNNAIEDYKEEVADAAAGTQGDFTTAYQTFYKDATTGALSAARNILNADGTFKNESGAAGENHYISEYGLTYVDASGTITQLIASDKWATQAEVTAFNNVLLKADKIKEAVDIFVANSYAIPKVGDTVTGITDAITKEQVALINTIISKFGDEDGEYDDQDYFGDEVEKIEDAKELFVIKAENATAFTNGITQLATAIGAEGTPEDSSTSPPTSAVAGTGARGLLGANTTFGETALDSKIYISADGYLYGENKDELIPASVTGEAANKWVPLSAVTAFDTAIKAVETKKATLDAALTDATLTPATKKELALIINADNDFEVDEDYFTDLADGLTDTATEAFTDAATVTTATSDDLHTELTALKGALAPAIIDNLAHDATDATAPTLNTPVVPGVATGDTLTVAVSNNGLTNEDGTAFASDITHYVTRANFDAFVTEIKAAIALRDDNVTAQVAKHKKDTDYLKTAKTTLDAAVTAYGDNKLAIISGDSAAFNTAYTSLKDSLAIARAKVDAAGAVVETDVYKSEYGLTYVNTASSNAITAIPNGKHWVTEAVVTAFNDVLKPADEIQLAVELFKVAGTRTGGAKEAYSIPAVGDSITPANPSGSTAVTVTQAHIDKINEVLAAYAADATWFTTENTKITTADDDIYEAAKKTENVTALTGKTGEYTTAITAAKALLEDGYADRGITTTKTDGSEAYISEDGMTYVVTTTTGSGEAATTTKTTTAIPSGKKYVTPTEVATFERALTTANELNTKLTNVTTLTDTKILDAIIKDGVLNADYFTSTADPKGVIVKLNDAKAAFAAAAKNATGGEFTSAYNAFATKIKEAIEGNVVNYTADATDGKHTLTPTAGNVLAPKSGIFVSDNGISIIKGTFTAGGNYVTENEFEDLLDEIQEAIDVRDKSIDQLVRSYDFNNSYFDNLVTKLQTALDNYTTAKAKVEKKTQFLAAVNTVFTPTAITDKLNAQIGDPLADPATKGITYTYEAAKPTPSDSSVSLNLGDIVISADGFNDVNGNAVGDNVKWITQKMNDDLADAILELEDIKAAALYDGTTVIEALAEKQEEVIDDYLDALGEDGSDGYFITLINGTGSGSGSGGTGNTTALEDAIAEFKPAASNAGEFTKLSVKLGELVNGTILGTAVDNNGDGDMTDQGEAVEEAIDDAWDAKAFVEKFKFGLTEGGALATDGAVDGNGVKLSRVSDDKGNDTLTLARLEVINGNALNHAQTDGSGADTVDDTTNPVKAAKKFYQYVTTATLTKLETALTKATEYNTGLAATGTPEELKNLQAEIKALEDAMTAFEASIVDLSSAENKNPREWLYELMVEAYKKKYIDINGTLTLVEKSDVGGVDIEEGHYWVKTATYDWFEAELAKSLLVLKDIDTDGTNALPANTEALNASIKVVSNASKYFVPAVSTGNSEYNTAKTEAFKALNVLVKQMGYTGLTSDAEGTVTDTEITADDITAAFTPVTDLTVAAVLYMPSEKFGYEVPVSKTWIPKKNFDEAITKLKTWAEGMIKSTTPVKSFEWYTTEITKWNDWFVTLQATNHGTKYEDSLSATDKEKTFKYLIDEITKYSNIIDGTDTAANAKGMPKIVGTTTDAIKNANQKETLLEYYWGDVSMDWDNGSYTAPTNYWAKKAEITPILNVYNNTIKWWLDTANFDISTAGSEKINHDYATLKKSYDTIKTTFENFYGKDAAGAPIAGITSKLYLGTDGSEHVSITESIRVANEFMNTLQYTHAATVPTTTYTLPDGTPNQQYTNNASGRVFVSGLTNGSDVPDGAEYYTQTFINSYVAAIKKAQDWLDWYERNPLTVKTADLDKHEKALTDLTAALDSNKKISTGNTAYATALAELKTAIEKAYTMIDVDDPQSRAANIVIRPSYNGEGAEADSTEKWVPVATYNWYKDTAIKQAEAGRDKKGATAAQLNATLATLNKNTASLNAAAKPGTQEVFETAQNALIDAIEDVDNALKSVIPTYYNGTDVKDGEEWVTYNTYNWLKGLNDKAISIYDWSYGSETLGLAVSVSKASTIDATKKTVKKADLVAQTTTLTKSLATFEAAVKESNADYASAEAKETLRVALDKFKNDLASIVYSKNKNGTDISKNYAWVTNDQVTLSVGGGSNYVKTTLQAAYDTAIKEYWKKPTDTTADFVAAKAALAPYQTVLDGILSDSPENALTGKAGKAGSLEAVATARTALGEKWGEAAAVIKGVHSIDTTSAANDPDKLLELIYPVLDGQYYASPTAIKAVTDEIENTKVLYNKKVTSGTTIAATATELDAQTTALDDAIVAFTGAGSGARVLVKRSVNTTAGDKGQGGISPTALEIVTLTMGDGSVLTLEHEIDQSLPEFDQPILIELPATDNYDDFSLDLEEEIFEELPDSAPEVEVPEIEIPEIEIPEIEVPEIEIPEIEDPDITTLEIAPEEYYEEEVYEEEYYEEEYYEENYYEEDYYEEEYYEEEIIEEVYEEIIEEIEIEEIEIEEIEVEEIEVEEIVIEEIAKSSPISKFFKKIFRL